MANPIIRPETPSDHAAIHALTVAAFAAAPHTSHTEQHIVDALRSAGVLSVSLVAEYSGELVGHVAASPVSISDGSEGWYGLAPLSVIPEWQRRGIGSLLMHEALAVLRDQRAVGCVLLGDPAFYSRFGFKPEPALVLPQVPSEFFQAIRFGSPLPRGIVSYHESFDVQG
jgi:putative acetyltransferase